jgi:dCMP deaminase
MRITRPQLWMGMAEIAAQRATCFRGSCGAILVKDNDVVSIGYNGPPSGEEHCQGNDCVLTPTGGCVRSLHAEFNAITKGAKKLRTLSMCDLYCTYSPCAECAQLIANSHLQAFFFRYAYRDNSGLNYLAHHHGLSLFRITPSGFIINVRTGELIEGSNF